MNTSTATAPPARAQTPARRLQELMAATRVSFTWFGTRKTLSREQKTQAAESFGAEGQFLSAAKKLVDTAHPAFRAVTSVRHQVVAYWRSVSLAYPEVGVRLIRRDRIEAFHEQMQAFRQELGEAVAQLEEHYEELKRSAQERLGRLYDPEDYPATLEDLFALEWDYPAFEAPDYLLRANPELYAEQQRRIAAQFQDAVKLAEEAFTSEFARLVAHLGERLSGSEDGKPKVFRNSAVEGLREFFGRFRDLNIGSSEQLEELVSQAQQIVTGIAPKDLRDNAGLRQQVRTQLSAVQATLDQMLVDRPRRKILRSSASMAQSEAS